MFDMITIKEYKCPDTIEEAYELNQKKSNKVIGGMLWIKMGKGNVNTAIDLSGLGLDKIEETDDEIHIGAMVTLRQLEEHKGLSSYTNGAMKEALHGIVGVQFRNLATVGGSIYGRFGFSDVLTVFMAMDSYVTLYKGGTIPLSEYAEKDYDRDLITGILIKKEKASFCYQSVRNTKTDFPVLTLSAAKMEDGTYRFSVGARPGKAVLLLDEKQILKGDIKAATDEFCEYSKEQIQTGSNVRGSREYRTQLVGVLVKRAIEALNER